MFGLIQIPFMLEDTLEQHFQDYMSDYPIIVEKLQSDMYVDY